MKAHFYLVIRVRCGDAFLLIQTPDTADLDPGHWGFPCSPVVHATPPAHAAMCGVALETAATIHAVFKAWPDAWAAISACATRDTWHSPAWHPRVMQVQIVDVTLTRRPSAIATPHQWASSAAWQQEFESGALLLNPLTNLLLNLEDGALGEDLWQHCQIEEPVAGLGVLPIASHTLPPADHTNAFLIGDDVHILIDPSPANEAAYQDLLSRLAEVTLSSILLTHHHPDHHQQSTRLARELNLPVWASADTLARIPKRFGKDYWQGIQTRTVVDGELLTHSRACPVRAHAVPGHDAGHLAIAPENRHWMIVGDLIQGIGTVVIAPPEGNMKQYFSSMQWVIAENPRVIVPSHGQAMGGTHRIQATLAHRQLREDQVFQLHQQGLDPQAMVETLYADVDKRLWGLARMTVGTHLDKLREEQRIV